MLDPLTLDHMRIFVAVAEEGSFRGAASRLRRAQSAISHGVASLEAQLGLPVFDRTARRTRLTPEGRTLLADAQAILAKADAFRARARGMGQGVELRLAIPLDPQFPLPIVADVLAELRGAYATVGIETWTAPLGAAIAALQAGACDFAITAADLPDPNIELEYLCDLPRAAVAAPDHPLARCGPPITRADLAEHIQIVVPDPSPLTADRDFDVLSPGTWRAGDNDTKRALILAGCGWGTLPLWLIQDDLAAGRLVRLAVADFGPGGTTYARAFLARRRDAPAGPAARFFRERLQRRLADSQVSVSSPPTVAL